MQRIEEVTHNKDQAGFELTSLPLDVQAAILERYADLKTEAYAHMVRAWES